MSTFSRSTDSRVVKNLKSGLLDPDQASSRGSSSFIGQYLPQSTYVPNLMCLSSTFARIWWGSKILRKWVTWPGLLWTTVTHHLTLYSFSELAV